MTVERNDLTLRPLTGPEELPLFTRLPYQTNDQFAADLAEGRRRPSWMWVALRGDRLVARAAWWSRPHHDAPFLLDVFDLDDTAPDRLDAGTRLLRAAMAEVVPPGAPIPEYTRFVPPDWRESPGPRRMVEERRSVLEDLGARPLVERLRMEWRRGGPVPEPDGRLVFRPVGDAEELIGLMADVLNGTLDAHGRADLTRMPARAAAEAQYEDELTGYPSPREWWRIATLPDGEPVGFVIPAHNGYNPAIAYIGVRPAHRGRGYVDEILGEGTRVLAAEGVDRIRASTDVGNTPMAKAFARAGYPVYEHQLDMTWG
ncbi:GNAT family N-acetyltransferase [Actinoallomurus sp. NBC_01490]|uniref:GNAT family N-acetyltransferase n=1 Tax=Actinoallomurus sp. NBC_01490 TaxID=2903557 RepID=UPI002E36D5C8|nr:GNAT family N-acetyltransferase [Actinoallomurus sp. NBC_01490]